MNPVPAPAPLIWHFPLRRPHTGVALGNGIQGLLVWGADTLRLTVARAGFWDHRNGHDIPPGTTFAGVRQALEKENDAALAALFPKRAPGAAFPQQFGGGRLELSFPSGLRPLEATLDLATADVVVLLGECHGAADTRSLRIRQTCDGEMCWIEGDAALLAETRIVLCPAFDLVRDHARAALGIAAPACWTETHGGGFLQTLPADAPLAVAWRKEHGRILFTTSLGAKAEHEVRRNLDQFDAAAADEARAAFWTKFWNKVARVSLPDPVLQRQFDYGLYRQAGLIRRPAPAATLQGPWMEDTAIPPWSNDYHFNINVQLVYGAALATGQAEEMEPLWAMLRAWLPRLRALGEGFYGVPGAMILPHAVDDRCQLMGSFWAGTIDQACIAWMAGEAYKFYAYTGDTEFLRTLVWPLLQGAFAGYSAMLESRTDDDGKKSYHLPISVSPEFGGSDRKKCWGPDASFQLAALHATIRLLRAAAPLLGQVEDPRWSDVAAHLAPYTLVDARDGGYGWIGQPAQRIALWEDKDLPESHRHHSHLAAIYPFCTINPFDPAHRKIVARSLNRWNTLGPGNWTGWCVPWASILCSRCGLVDAAHSWLHLLAKQFTNEGHATLHNADAAGVFAWDDGSLAWPDHRKGSDYEGYEVMQMDAAMGAIKAILELIVSCRDGVVYITDRLPKGWRELEFSGIRTEGGFIIDGKFRNGRAEEMTIVSARGGVLRIVPALGENWTLDGEFKSAQVPVLETHPGQVLRLCRADCSTSFLLKRSVAV
jgi:hypothetical protein